MFERYIIKIMSIENPQLNENRQKSKTELNLQPIEAFVEKNPQLVEGKLQYAISGSTAVILFADAENIKVYSVDIAGNLSLLESENVEEKTQHFLKENLSKFGTPSDIDICFSQENFPVGGASLVDDEYVLQEGERILSGNIKGKEYFFETPQSYLVKIFSNKYMGLSDKVTVDKKQGRLQKMEITAEAVLKDHSINEIAEEIERTIQNIEKTYTQMSPVYKKAQKETAEQLLSSPHKMYEWLAHVILNTPDGRLDANLDINRFPRVKEIIDTLSTRHSK